MSAESATIEQFRRLTIGLTSLAKALKAGCECSGDRALGIIVFLGWGYEVEEAGDPPAIPGARLDYSRFDG